MHRPIVLISQLGTTIDAGRPNAERWSRWRPTVSICSQEDLAIARLEIIEPPHAHALGDLVAADIATVSPETKILRHAMAMNDPWDFEEVYSKLYDWASAYPFDPGVEDYLVHMTTGTHVSQICLFLLVETRVIPGRLVQSMPPDRRDSSRGGYSLIDLDLSKYDRLASRSLRRQTDARSTLKSGIATRNTAFNELIDRVQTVASRSREPMLLTGPTGSGKSQLARQIHQIKLAERQVGVNLVEVNCATLRGDGAMSALFGHKKGSFTGATADRPGLLRAADGGLLFLDEIGELGPDEQAMLLRAIEDKRFTPLGSDAEVSSNFQLIAGTNRDLRLMVRDGGFRDDLLARINLWTFALPA